MINIINEYGYKFDENQLNEYVRFLDVKMDNNLDYSIVFLENNVVKSLNNEFRGINKVTDVLSFEEKTEDYLGDILIAIDVLKDQAMEYGHSEIRELYFLITHGFLHLLGYDHQNENEELEMFDLQKKLLSEYGMERI